MHAKAANVAREFWRWSVDVVAICCPPNPGQRLK
jgi:hypothetical protein